MSIGGQRMNPLIASETEPGGPTFPAESLRAHFPALERAGSFIFFDNAAGAQIPQSVLDAVIRHLVDQNVQRGGRYPRSMAVDAAIARARATVGAFVNARRPEEIAFGMNATSFIRLISLAVGQSLGGRNEIVVTDLDHEANVATWLALQGLGARFLWWKIRADGCLHTEDLKPCCPRVRASSRARSLPTPWAPSSTCARRRTWPMRPVPRFFWTLCTTVRTR
jgi:selenocysteine lyase/cysteine desulfurase